MWFKKKNQKNAFITRLSCTENHLTRTDGIVYQACHTRSIGGGMVYAEVNLNTALPPDVDQLAEPFVLEPKTRSCRRRSWAKRCGGWADN